MPPPFPKVSPARILINALQPGRPSILAGRVRAHGASALLLEDASGAVPLTLPPHEGIRVDGALIEARGLLARGVFAATSLRLLTRPRRASPSPALPPPPSAAALRARAALNAAIRAFFDGQGFTEVETPALVPSPGTDVYLEAFETRFAGLGAFPAASLYLHTSPEFAMKRLLSYGMERIYQLCRCYRDGEATGRHNPEFTMVEWYRAFSDYGPIMEDVEALVRAALGPTCAAGGATVDLTAPFERLAVREAFARHCRGLDILELDSAEALRAAAAQAGLGPLIPGGGWDDLFHELLLLYVEPHLGASRPTLLLDYPAPLAVLARRRDDDPRLAERFELYVAGVELCNGFTELNDPDEQRARFEEDLARRARQGLRPYPMPTWLLDALERGMPPSGGVALGVDRLLMLQLGVDDIGAVLMRAVPPSEGGA